MAHVSEDRVRDTSTTTGTGTITLSGTAPTGYLTLDDVASTNDTFFYVIQHRTAAEWEVGLGVKSAADQFTRTAIRSSNSNAAVNFSAGTKDWAIVDPAFLAFGNVNAQTASYTLVLGDMFKLVTMSNASANNLTIPPNSSVAFPLMTRIDVAQVGAGQTTLVEGSGVTINSKSGNKKITGQYSAATIIKTGTDTWLAIGDLSA